MAITEHFSTGHVAGLSVANIILANLCDMSISLSIYGGAA